jgi:hypothetical protein
MVVFKMLNMFGLKKLTRKGLKQSYKRLSKIYHPDNKETGDAEMFLKINEAYNILLKQTIKQTYIVETTLDEIIGGKIITINDTQLCITLWDYFKNKSRIVKINDELYKLKIKILLDKNTKIVKNKIVKIKYLKINDIINGFVLDNINGIEYKIDIPRENSLNKQVQIKINGKKVFIIYKFIIGEIDVSNR